MLLGWCYEPLEIMNPFTIDMLAATAGMLPPYIVLGLIMCAVCVPSLMMIKLSLLLFLSLLCLFHTRLGAVCLRSVLL